MKKTTIYLPEDLKSALGRLAVQSGRSEAELIREAVRELVRDSEPPRPRLPLFSSGDPTLDVLTLDERHFRTLRGAGGDPFRLLPADAG